MSEQPLISLNDDPSQQQGWLNTAYEDHLVEQQRAVATQEVSPEEVAKHVFQVGAYLNLYVRPEAERESVSRDSSKPSQGGGLFGKVMGLIVGDETAAKTVIPRGVTRRELIRLESQIGRELFGPVPAEHRREFFNLDQDTWVWHEEWTDADAKRQMVTTRYEIHPNGILKVQDGQPYHFLDGDELHYFATATRLYYERVMGEVYHRNPATGEPMTPLHGSSPLAA